MRWLLLLASLVGFGIAFQAKTPGMLGLGVVLGFVALFCAVFAFAAARIAATSQPETSLLTDRDISKLRASLRKPATPSPGAPPAAKS